MLHPSSPGTEDAARGHFQTITFEQPFPLEGGGVLPGLTLAYHTWGRLNAARNNVIWICHALTASSDAAAWWPGMIGPGKAFDTDRYFVVCANSLGSCYGSTGPLADDPAAGRPYYGAFPLFTIRDTVKAFSLLCRSLDIASIALLAGGSMGGYCVLEWAVLEPKIIRQLFLIATSPRESAWGIAIHSAQRLAIEADGSWGQPEPAAGAKGLKAARAFGMVTYRSYQTYRQAQDEEGADKIDGYRASSYINYQGDKLVKRFNAYSYWFLTKAMDSHDLSRGRGGVVGDVLKTLTQRSLIVAIEEDVLCPAFEQEAMSRQMPNATYRQVNSLYGHDGFLVETDKVSALLKEWKIEE